MAVLDEDGSKAFSDMTTWLWKNLKWLAAPIWATLETHSWYMAYDMLEKVNCQYYVLQWGSIPGKLR